MAITYTTNLGLAMPTSGTEVGVWGPPINTNSGIIDNAFGGLADIAITSTSAIVLSSAQYQNAFLRFSSTLTANVSVTLPAIGSFHTIINDTTGSSAFYVTLATTAAGGEAIALPPATMVDIFTDGTNARFRGLPHVGSYWDYAGSSTPAWVTACTKPPWVYCNGGTFSSATYPQLASVLGSTTLPDFRGRSAFYLNDGTGRLTSSQGGVDGNTRFAAGGIQTTSLSTVNLPNMNFPVTDPGHTHTVNSNANSGTHFWGVNNIACGDNNAATITLSSAVTGISVNSGGSNATFSVIPPSIVSGIRLVRAA